MSWLAAHHDRARQLNLADEGSRGLGRARRHAEDVDVLTGGLIAEAALVKPVKGPLNKSLTVFLASPPLADELHV